MRVCYFGTYRAGYNRNKIMIAALKSADVDVVICQENLWYSIEDRENVTTGGWRSPKFWWRVIRTYTKLLIKSLSIGKFDVMVLGYPGQIDVFLAKIICSLKKTPLVLDVLMSLYLVAIERNLDAPPHSAVNLIRKMEKKSLGIPDLLIQDTPQYVSWFYDTFTIDSNRFRLVPIGADDNIFKPLEQPEVKKEKLRVLYYGTFIPNHGLDHILEAAKQLSSRDDIEFLFIGEGPEKTRIVEKSELENLKNITFTGWCSQLELVEQIGVADVCLGAFGRTPQSLMTIHNKIYECMACAKTVITGISPAIQSQFTDMVELKMCDRSGEAIAETIIYLKENPDVIKLIGLNARQSFIDNYSISALGRKFRSHLETLL